MLSSSNRLEWIALLGLSHGLADGIGDGLLELFVVGISDGSVLRAAPEHCDPARSSSHVRVASADDEDEDGNGHNGAGSYVAEWRKETDLARLPISLHESQPKESSYAAFHARREGWRRLGCIKRRPNSRRFVRTDSLGQGRSCIVCG